MNYVPIKYGNRSILTIISLTEARDEKPPSWKRSEKSMMTERRLILSRVLGACLLIAMAAMLTGCGSTGFGGLSNNLGGDLSPGYNTSLASHNSGDNRKGGGGVVGTYPHIESKFTLKTLPGDPFDYEAVNVRVALKKPDGSTVESPAFYDGGDTWRMRFTPNMPGNWSVVSVKVNQDIVSAASPEPKEWNVKGDPSPGFVRIDRGDHARFVFDSGARYYPLGHNLAWHSEKLPEITETLGKMHSAGENWSRLWMNHWDGKNLDWSADSKGQVKPGAIDLEAAKRWDNIVDAAEKNGIYFQLVLQHHGQYSTTVNSNWDANPYNVKNGGWLTNPEDFFTDAKARALTKRKIYYILARYGYSPAILAYELFNEVQFTDAGREKQYDKIALWHHEMALFIKQYDGNHHLVTTSSASDIALNNPIWDTVDYIQAHVYASDLVTAQEGLTASDAKSPDKPLFVGEFGGSGNAEDAEGHALHIGLWSSMMLSASGAAQYWSWDTVEKDNLYGQFTAASKFLVASGLSNHGGLVTQNLPVTTKERAALRFAPGGGFADAKQSEFVVGDSGVPAGIAQYPAFLQGQNHHAMTPTPLTFHVSYPQAGTFSVEVGQVAKSGAHLVLKVDGTGAQADFPASGSDYAPKGDAGVLSLPVSAGAHTISVENTGADWVAIRQFVLSDYAPALSALGRVGPDYAIAWIWSRAGVDAAHEKSPAPISGKVTLSNLKSGAYRLTWWDTESGTALNSSLISVGKGQTELTLDTPAITRDAALFFTKDLKEPAKADKRKRSKNNAVAASAAGH